jgi:hypothetical protein
MSKMFVVASLPIAVAVGLMLSGCSTQQPAVQPGGGQEQPAAADQADNAIEPGSHAGHEAGQAGHGEHADHAGHGQYEDALAELSPAEQQLAEKQEVCPVSGQPLGSMGTPYKVTVKGREVLLCCAGCESQIKEDPEKYLAKLPE